MQEYLFPSDVGQSANGDGSGHSILPATSHPDGSSLMEESTSSVGTMFTALDQSMVSSNTYVTGVTTPQLPQLTSVHPPAQKEVVRRKEPGESASKFLKGFKIPKSKKVPILKPPQVPATPPAIKESKARPILHQFGKVAPKAKGTAKKKMSPKEEVKTTPRIGPAPTQTSIYVALKKKKVAEEQLDLSSERSQGVAAPTTLPTPEDEVNKSLLEKSRVAPAQTSKTGEGSSPLSAPVAPDSLPTSETKKGAKRIRVKTPPKPKLAIHLPSSVTPPAKKVQRPEAPSVVTLFRESMAKPNPATESS